MAFDDWDVEIVDIARRTNSAKNPLTGLPIDPDGLTQSFVTMTLTHRASGRILNRADLFSAPSADALKKYARDVIAVADLNMSVQKTVDETGATITESPLKGPLDVTIPLPADTRTQAQKDLQAFQQADADHVQTLALADKLKAIDPAEASDLDKLVAAKLAARDAAAAPVIAALVADATAVGGVLTP